MKGKKVCPFKMAINLATPLEQLKCIGEDCELYKILYHPAYPDREDLREEGCGLIIKKYGDWR